VCGLWRPFWGMGVSFFWRSALALSALGLDFASRVTFCCLSLVSLDSIIGRLSCEVSNLAVGKGVFECFDPQLFRSLTAFCVFVCAVCLFLRLLRSAVALLVVLLLKCCVCLLCCVMCRRLRIG